MITLNYNSIIFFFQKWQTYPQEDRWSSLTHLQQKLYSFPWSIIWKIIGCGNFMPLLLLLQHQFFIKSANYVSRTTIIRKSWFHYSNVVQINFGIIALVLINYCFTLFLWFWLTIPAFDIPLSSYDNMCKFVVKVERRIIKKKKNYIIYNSTWIFLMIINQALKVESIFIHILKSFPTCTEWQSLLISLLLMKYTYHPFDFQFGEQPKSKGCLKE